MESDDPVYPKKKVIEWLKVVVGDMEENMRLLAPDGWEASPYFVFLHPNPEQRYGSYVKSHDRWSFMPQRKNEPLLSFDEYIAEEEYEDQLPIRPMQELYELIGNLLYGMSGLEFRDPSGSIIAIESDRSAATFVASFLNMHYLLDEVDFNEYHFFHMNSPDDHIDPYPIYLLFFERMKEKGYDMIYRMKETPEDTPGLVKAYLEVYRKKPLQKG